MPGPKAGVFKHSEETRRKMSNSRKGRKFSAEHRAALSAALSGRKIEARHKGVCPCGKSFSGASPYKKFCSLRCRRASIGHGRRHAPEYKHFIQECAICESNENLVGDHCHESGTPRGILCKNCNLAIGNMKDNPLLLRKAAEYLENLK